MCECNLIIGADNSPIDVPVRPHNLIYRNMAGAETVLLKNFMMPGVINYSSVSAIKDAHGVKTGYIIVVGEKSDER